MTNANTFPVDTDSDVDKRWALWVHLGTTYSRAGATVTAT